MDDFELSRTSAVTEADIQLAKAGLKKLLKEGRVSPATVLACQELVELAQSQGPPATDEGLVAAAITQAIRLAVENVKEHDAVDALLGFVPSTEGESLQHRRERAAALLGIKPESFRVRRESQLLDKLAHALVVEVAGSHSGNPPPRDRREPRLFASASLEGRDLIDALDHHLSGKASVVTWTEPNWGHPGFNAMEAMGRALDEADFGVFVLSPEDVAAGSGQIQPGRDNVIFELGFAMGRLGAARTFLLVPKGLKSKAIPSDLGAVSVIYYEVEGDRQENAASLARRLWQEVRALGPRARPESTQVPDRGDTGQIEMFVDAAVALDFSRTSYADELRRAVQWGKRVPAKFRFAHAEGADFWLRLCRSFSNRYFQRAQRSLRRNAASLAEGVHRAAGTTAVDLISLGCGDGSKDDILLKALARELKDDESLCYYPVEISDVLLVEALRQISKGRLDRSLLRSKGILGDFTKLEDFSGVFEDRPSTNLFSVLGNAIGSFDEPEIFASLDRAMLPGDLVLIEANIGRPDDSVALLEEDTAIMWDLSILDALGLPRASCELGTELREDVSLVPYTKTLIRYAESSEKARKEKYSLSAIHHYDLASLRRHVESELNVELVDEIAGNGVGFLLGQRSA